MAENVTADGIQLPPLSVHERVSVSATGRFRYKASMRKRGCYATFRTWVEQRLSSPLG